MNPHHKVKEFLLIGGIIVTMVAVVVISSSRKELSVSAPQAATNAAQVQVQGTLAPTPTSQPTLLIARNQDVPLKVTERKEGAKVPSYFYIELATNGIIGNYSNSSVSIYWLTEVQQPTQLRYGLSENQLLSSAKGSSSVFLHEAILTKLQSNTVYFYTGHAPVIESFTTPPLLTTTPISRRISGVLRGGSGKCIIRGIFTRGTLSSTYTVSATSTTNWELPINSLRTDDLSNYFEPKSTDKLQIDAICVLPSRLVLTGTKTGVFGNFLGLPVELSVTQENVVDNLKMIDRYPIY